MEEQQRNAISSMLVQLDTKELSRTKVSFSEIFLAFGITDFVSPLPFDKTIAVVYLEK